MADATRPAITRILPLYPHGFFVQWDLTSTESGTFKFDLYRSGGAQGPWEPVSLGMVSQYAFVDRLPQPAGTQHDVVRRPNQLALMRSFFYRLVVTAPSGKTTEVVDDTEPPIDRKMMQYWRRATFDFDKTLKFTGVPTAVLKKRHWGLRCTKCVDRVTREVVRAACPECFGTRFDGGYWAPTLMRLRMGVPNNVTLNSPEQKQDANSEQVYMRYFPHLERDDVIVTLRDNKRFVVDQQIETQIQTAVVHQVLSVLELTHDHIIHRLRVDADSVQPLI
jgi:hypothetical protein